jgi:hypothetical protein
MKIKAKLTESSQTFSAKFGEVYNISDGGYERGYEAGYVRGQKEGEQKGYADGLAARTYEIWTFTLTDGTVVEKEVALL